MFTFCQQQYLMHFVKKKTTTTLKILHGTCRSTMYCKSPFKKRWIVVAIFRLKIFFRKRAMMKDRKMSSNKIFLKFFFAFVNGSMDKEKSYLKF